MKKRVANPRVLGGLSVLVLPLDAYIIAPLPAPPMGVKGKDARDMKSPQGGAPKRATSQGKELTSAIDKAIRLPTSLFHCVPRQLNDVFARPCQI